MMYFCFFWNKATDFLRCAEEGEAAYDCQDASLVGEKLM